MNFKRHGIMAGVMLTATLALAACGTDDNSAPGSTTTSGSFDCATGTLTAQGSTAQKNAMDQWIKEYQTRCSEAQINYQGTGSGAGIEAFINNTADFAGSDSALKDEEQPKADARCGSGTAINLPMVVGPIAVVYNLDGVGNLQLKPETIAKIFNGTVTKWDDATIKADNPGATLPSTSILTVHRSDSSGTTDNFTRYLSKAASGAWTYDHDKVWKAPGGSAEKGNDGIGASLAKNPGSIGYVELSFAQANSLKIAKVYNGAGEYVELTPEAAGKTLAGAKITGTGNDLKMDIDYTTTEPGAYPIVLVTYEVICEKGNPADKLDLLKSFFTYAATDGQTALATFGYGPLPPSVQSKVETAISSLG